MQVIQAREKHIYLLVEMMHELAMSDVGRRDQTDAYLESSVREILKDPEWTTLILREDDASPAGYVIFRVTSSNQFPGETVALLHDFLVRRPYRRRGYGRRFYQHIHERYFQGKVSRIFLTVPSKNDRAVAFWEAMGLVVEGVRMRAVMVPQAADAPQPDPTTESSTSADEA